MKRAAILIVLYLCWITFNNFRKLGSEQAATELDTMDALLVDVPRYISPASHLAFKTNTSPGRHGVLYFKSAMIVAPAVLQLESDADTVLLLEELSLPAASKDNYQILAQGANQQMKYTLMRVKK